MYGRLVNLVGLVIIVVLSMGIGYWLGQENSKYLNATMKEELVFLKTQRSSTMELLTQLKAEAKAANLRFEQLKENYTEEMGSGSLPELMTLVKAQLDKGVMPERLASVIRSARPPEKCSQTLAGKVIVKTKAYNGAGGQISVADGNIMISASGESSISETGKPEAWYDSALPVAITFKVAGEETQVKEGTLPIHHSIILNDREYRFTLSEGAVSYVDITYDSCAYP